LGLSATVVRKDGQYPIVLMNLGEVLYSNTRNATPAFAQKVFPRLNRASQGKKEIQVYDYVDEKVSMLARMYGRRLKGYKAMGFVVG